MSIESGIFTSAAAGLATPQTGWVEVLSLAAEDSAAAIATFGSYNLRDTIPQTNVIDLREKFGNGWNSLVLGVYAGPIGGQNPADGDTFGLDIVSYRNSLAGPPLLVATIAADAGIIGTLPVDYNPANPGGALTNCYWADTAALTFSDWPGEPKIFDSGNNRVALLDIDMCGSRYLLFNRHGVDGSVAGEAPAIRILGWTY
jgi:hypothetical protein